MNLKEEAAREAVKLVKNEMIVGLGAGSTMAYMAGYLKQATERGLKIKVLSSSFTTRKLLEEYNLYLADIAAVSKIDIYFDGCDQFDKDLHALKSGGGIHTMEKLFASMAKAFVLVGDEEKHVDIFDAKFPLVIELLPESLAFVQFKMQQIFPQSKCSLRMSDAKDGAVITKHGNYLIDIFFGKWPTLDAINPLLKNIPGIVETSLFYGMADKAIIAGVQGVTILTKNSRAQ